MLFLHSGSPFGMHLRSGTGLIVSSHDDLLLLRVNSIGFHLFIRISMHAGSSPEDGFLRLFIAKANAEKGVAFTLANNSDSLLRSPDVRPVIAGRAKKTPQHFAAALARSLP